MQNVVVWDFPTRIFHWALFLLVLFAYLSAEDEGLAYQVHVAAGYGIGILILFRLVWGILGSRHSRFDDYVRTLRSLPDYIRQLFKLKPQRYTGHNPAGMVMIAAMLLTLVAALLTGLYAGEDLHEFFGNLIVILAAVHVCGVLLDSFLTRENLIAAMISGRKSLSDEVAVNEPGEPPTWRFVLSVLLTILIAAIGFTQIEKLTWPPTINSSEVHNDHHDQKDD